MSHLADGAKRFKEFVLPSGRRIDFLETVTGTVFELKPNNALAMRQEIRQINSYISELKSMPQFQGINWKGVLDLY
ncbi:MAG: hypothetical protein KDB22_30135 [Planctomycetales bacterium]|nr:hypothetical protein [Planctomycetales bacterium]